MFHGSIVALVTPMRPQGEIDYESVEKLLDFHLNHHTAGLVVAGTTGESGTLSETEKHALARFIVKEVNSRIPVIVGTGATSTTQSIQLTSEAMALGADACLLMSPAYIKPTQLGLYEHFKAIAKAVPIPLIVYNVPGRTACDILPETVAKLADIANIVGIKEASGSVERSLQLLESCGDRIDIYCGEDRLAKDVMLAGGKGVISVNANIVPQQMHELCVAALAGNRDEAIRIDNDLQGLHSMLFSETNPIPVKWAAHQMGLIPQGIRSPLTWLSEQYHQPLRAAMEAAGLTISI